MSNQLTFWGTNLLIWLLNVISSRAQSFILLHEFIEDLHRLYEFFLDGGVIDVLLLRPWWDTHWLVLLNSMARGLWRLITILELVRDSILIELWTLTEHIPQNKRLRPTLLCVGHDQIPTPPDNLPQILVKAYLHRVIERFNIPIYPCQARSEDFVESLVFPHQHLIWLLGGIIPGEDVDQMLLEDVHEQLSWWRWRTLAIF